MLLSNKLDLAHTCCENEDYGWPLDPSDGSESEADDAEEQPEKVALFKRLLPLAVDRWKAYSGPSSKLLLQFVQSEIRNGSNDWNDEYACNVKEIEVKLDRSL